MKNTKTTKKAAAKPKAPKPATHKPVVTPRVRAPRAAAKVVESRHMSELAPKDRQYLEELLRMEPTGLTEGEHAHLSARAAYLTTDERKKYGI